MQLATASNKAAKPRVLIVDDNPRQRARLSEIVTDLGWSASFANDGAAACSACAATAFDLIIMDYRMPEMNGIDATREIRDMGGWAARVPIVGATADYSPPFAQRCIQAGMTDCIAKPIQPLAFKELLRRALAPARDMKRRAAG